MVVNVEHLPVGREALFEPHRMVSRDGFVLAAELVLLVLRRFVIVDLDLLRRPLEVEVVLGRRDG